MVRGKDPVPGDSRTPGFSLTEVLVALVVLEVGLLGVVSLGALASREVARAAALQRATGALEVTADSLLRSGSCAGAGERVVGPHLVRWHGHGAGLRMEVLAAGGSGPLLRADLPWPR